MRERLTSNCFGCLLWLVLFGLPTTGWADVVMGPPTNCPPGYRPATDHGGPYCQPPLPAHCPPGHTPRVDRDEAYCQPLPPVQCPDGSNWTSNRRDRNGFCLAKWRCSGSCGAGEVCGSTRFCIEQRRGMGHGRSAFLPLEVVVGLCGPDGSCPDGGACVVADRCQTPLLQLPPPTPPPPPPDPVPPDPPDPRFAPPPPPPGVDMNWDVPPNPGPGCRSCYLGGQASASGWPVLLVLGGLLRLRK